MLSTKVGQSLTLIYWLVPAISEVPIQGGEKPNPADFFAYHEIWLIPTLLIN